MANYLCLRIRGGYLNYATVIPMYMQFKEAVDACLISHGMEHLIVDL